MHNHNICLFCGLSDFSKCSGLTPCHPKNELDSAKIRPPDFKRNRVASNTTALEKSERSERLESAALTQILNKK